MSLSYDRIGLLADGTAFPESVIATMPVNNASALVEIHFVIQNGQPEMFRYSVIGSGQPLDASTVHALPVATIAKAAVRKILGVVAVDVARQEAMRNAPASFSVDPGPPGDRAVGAFNRRPGPATDAELREVAEIVQTHRGAPRLEIKRRLNVSERTASRWIKSPVPAGLSMKEDRTMPDKTTRSRRRKGRRTFGNVWQLPSGRYRASYLGPDGKRRGAPSTFPTVADADAWLSNVSTEIVSGDWRPPEPSRETFGAYAKRHLALSIGRDGKPLSPTTAELYALLWRRWLSPTFADVAIGDITTESVRTWLGEARPAHRGSTQPDKAYRLLRAILNVAVDDEKIRVNPCRIRGGGKESAPERPIAMPESVLAIADSIDEQYRALVVLAAWCSLRFGELAGLRRSRVDLLHRQIHVLEQAVELDGGKVVFKSPKSDSGRTVEIPDDLMPILTDHLAEHVGPARGRAGVHQPRGSPVAPDEVPAAWAGRADGGRRGSAFPRPPWLRLDLGCHRRGRIARTDAPTRPQDPHGGDALPTRNVEQTGRWPTAWEHSCGPAVEPEQSPK